MILPAGSFSEVILLRVCSFELAYKHTTFLNLRFQLFFSQMSCVMSK